MNRRRMLGLAGAGALAVAVGPATLNAAAAPAVNPAAAPALPQAPAAPVAALASRGRDTLWFSPIAPVAKTVDALTVPRGYTWDSLIRWGDPVTPGAPTFDVEKQTEAAQLRQFGYNNDYTDIIATDASGRHALLVCNHEYVNPRIMFPPHTDPTVAKRVAMAAHGMSVVELQRRRKGEPWKLQRSGVRRNRRVHTATPFRFDGPAAGSDLLKTAADPNGMTVLGTLGNCSGDTTPWGTVLSGEENFNGYFRSAGTSEGDKRYGLTDIATSNGWETIEPRFDARHPDYLNEPHRFGWIVELDPMDPSSTPVKHTGLGRLKHEGAEQDPAQRRRSVRGALSRRLGVQ